MSRGNSRRRRHRRRLHRRCQQGAITRNPISNAQRRRLKRTQWNSCDWHVLKGFFLSLIFSCNRHIHVTLYHHFFYFYFSPSSRVLSFFISYFSFAKMFILNGSTRIHTGDKKKILSRATNNITILKTRG